MKGNRIDWTLGAGLPILALVLLVMTVVGYIHSEISNQMMIILFGLEALYFSYRSHRNHETILLVCFYLVFGLLLILFGGYFLGRILCIIA